MKIDETKVSKISKFVRFILYYLFRFKSDNPSTSCLYLFHNMRKKFRNKHRKNKVRNNQCVISKDPGIQNGLNFL